MRPTAGGASSAVWFRIGSRRTRRDWSLVAAAAATSRCSVCGGWGSAQPKPVPGLFPLIGALKTRD